MQRNLILITQEDLQTTMAKANEDSDKQILILQWVQRNVILIPKVLSLWTVSHTKDTVNLRINKFTLEADEEYSLWFQTYNQSSYHLYFRELSNKK